MKRSKILSVLLAAIMVFSCFSCLTVISSAAVLKEEVETDEEGNVISKYWSVEDTGVLTIYQDVEGTPWEEFASIINTVIVEAGVKMIPNSAFAGYPVLSQVIFKGTLNLIAAGAFQNCDELVSLVIPGTTEIQDYAFYDCDKLESVVICGGLANEMVGKNIFKNCDKLESVEILNGALEIGEGMFEDCMSLKTLSLPDSIVSIGRLAFENCSSLENIIVPDSTVAVGEYAFYGCSSVKTAYIGHNVQDIGEYAFGECTALEDVEIKCAMPVISDGMFLGCSSLKGLSALPAGIKYIGKNAFKDCSAFNEINLPSTVEEIADSAFDGTALVEINIPASVETIGAGVFTNCNSLIDINVDAKNRFFASVDGALYDIDLETLICCPAGKSGTFVVYNGVTEIGADGFIGCENLEVVEIPSSVTTIAANAFNGCSDDIVIKADCNSAAIAFAVKRGIDNEPVHVGGDEWQVTLEPTCLDDGAKELVCSGCGFVHESVAIPALDHDYDDGVVTTKATCEADGVITFTCTREGCDDSYTKPIPATKHNFDNGKVISSATCENDGTMRYSCQNSGCYEYYDEVIPALGHNMDDGTIKTKATCETDGEKVYKCLNSGCLKKESEVIPATGHKMDDGTVALAATCTEDGEKVYKCQNADCDHEESVVLPATGHDYEAKSTKATCIKDGVITYTCKNCGDTYKETFKGDHSLVSTKTEPTCDKEGEEGMFCVLCHQFVGETKVIAAKGHTFKNGKCVDCGKSSGVAKPGTPKLVSVKNTIRGPILKWKAAKNATVYKVYVLKSTGKWSCIATLDAEDGVSYVHTKAKSGTKYTYTVKALNGDVPGGYDKNGISITFIDDPELKSIANAADGVKVTWGKVTGATKYAVYRRTAATDWKKIATVKGTSYVDKNVKSGTGYIYVVRASDGSTLSSYDGNGINIVFVGAPKLSSATSTKSGIVLKWSKVAKADGYIVYRKTSGGEYERIAKVKGNATVSYKDKSAKKGVKYTYVVKAYDGSTKSYKSNAKTLKDKY